MSGFSPYRLEVVSEQRLLARSSSRRFDRLAFALRALDLLRPRAVSVVVYRSTRLHVSQGRDLRAGGEARWALVGVPDDASEESITLTLAEIAGMSDVPFALDVALSATRLGAD